MKIVVLYEDNNLTPSTKRDIANHTGVSASDFGYGIENITAATEVVVIVSPGANVPMAEAKAAFSGHPKTVFQYSPHSDGPRGISCPSFRFDEVVSYTTHGYFRRVTNYHTILVNDEPSAVLY